MREEKITIFPLPERLISKQRDAQRYGQKEYTGGCVRALLGTIRTFHLDVHPAGQNLTFTVIQS